MSKLSLIGLFLLINLLLPVNAKAAVPITRLRVEAELQSSGAVKVVQTISFTAPNRLDWKLFSKARSLEILADGQTLPKNNYQLTKLDNRQHIQTNTEASIWQIRYTTASALIRHSDRDQIFFQLFQTPGQAIFDIQVTFRLPPTETTSDLRGNPYAIGGVSGLKTVLDTEQNTLVFSADYAAPGSLLTTSANWSKSVLKLSAPEELRLFLLNLELLPWLFLGGFLPLISLLALLHMRQKQRESEHTITTVSDQLPSNLPAILVGVLVEKKIYPREMVALLVQLCQRGYLVIVQKGGDYFLSTRSPVDQHLENWEREIIEQLFPNQDSPSNRKDQALHSLNDKSLFSPKVRDAFAQIYQVITEKQFFAENPHFTRIRYKLFALSLYFLSAIGLVWVTVTRSSPYLLIPLGGSIAIAFLIIKLTPKLIRYSPNGLATRDAWMAFSNYLSLAQPLPLESIRNHTFEKFLPYAIALDKTHEWGRRFDLSRTAIIRPDWFVTYHETTATQFIDEIFHFTESISKSLTNLRGPLVN